MKDMPKMEISCFKENYSQVKDFINPQKEKIFSVSLQILGVRWLQLHIII